MKLTIRQKAALEIAGEREALTIKTIHNTLGEGYSHAFYCLARLNLIQATGRRRLHADLYAITPAGREALAPCSMLNVRP